MSGWKVYHTYDSRKSPAGFPDLVLVRDRVIFAELKTQSGQASKEQVEWMEALRKNQCGGLLVETVGYGIDREGAQMNHEETAKRLLPWDEFSCELSDEDTYEKIIGRIAAALAEAEVEGRNRQQQQSDLIRCYTEEGVRQRHEIARLKAEVERLTVLEKASRDGNAESWNVYHKRGEENDALRTRLAEAERELARIQALPEQEWTEVGAIILQILASAARAGYSVRETDAVKAFDRGQTYVTKLRADLDSARAEIENIKTVEFPRRIEKISKGCLAKGRREGLERAKEIALAEQRRENGLAMEWARRGDTDMRQKHQNIAAIYGHMSRMLDNEIAKAGGEHADNG